jgi:hypothetical protein
MILIFPAGGIANRMRVIDSAVRLCEDLNCRYKIFWSKRKELNCEYDNIWMPIKNMYNSRIVFWIMLLSYTICKRSKSARKILCVLEKLNILKIFTSSSLINDDNNEFLQKNSCDFKKIRICIIYTYSSFYQKAPYYQMFVLNKEMVTTQVPPLI